MQRVVVVVVSGVLFGLLRGECQVSLKQTETRIGETPILNMFRHAAQVCDVFKMALNVDVLKPS